MIKFFRKKALENSALNWTRLMWEEGLWEKIKWLGTPILQWPTDLIILQEIVYDQKPKFIIETGTYKGGSAVFFASLLTLLKNNGKVISVESNLSKEVRQKIKKHAVGKKIILIEGSSTSDSTIKNIKKIVGNQKKIMVFLDSDHSFGHVLNELRIYQQFVPVGGYICAFDTITKDLYDLPKGNTTWKNDNPYYAVLDFIKENKCFKIDKTRNRLQVGFAPDGFLKRIKK